MFFLLFLRAAKQNRVPCHGLDLNNERGRDAPLGDFLNRQAQIDVIPIVSSILLRDAQTQKPHFLEDFFQVPGVVARPVDLRSTRCDFFLNHLSYLISKHLLIIIQDVHGLILSWLEERPVSAYH